MFFSDVLTISCWFLTIFPMMSSWANTNSLIIKVISDACSTICTNTYVTMFILNQEKYTLIKLGFSNQEVMTCSRLEKTNDIIHLVKQK